MTKIANPSPEQQAFFDAVTNGKSSLLLEAVAGSGKTSTLVHALELMRGQIFFGAYNKKIADEIKSRVPAGRTGIFVSTMHAAGFSAWRRAAPKVKVDDRKCLRLTEHMGIAVPAVNVTCSLVSLAKQAAFGVLNSVDDDSEWYRLIEHFNIDLSDNDPKVIVTGAKELLKASIATDSATIDFDDMIYAPLVHKARVFEHDWVLIDEAQDTNASRRALALRLLKRGGRLIAVGDPHQAIYGFTGADADSLGLIGAAVNAQRMSLSVSYRCPRAVVEHAQQYVHHIAAAPGAPEGVVRTGTSKEVAIGDVVLCRFNKPLISLAFEMIAAGKPAKVEGRDIGNGLKALARKWKVRSLADLATRLETYVERETAKLRAKEKESAAVAVEDKVGCLMFLLRRTQSADKELPDLLAEIDSLFADDADPTKMIILSSIHKSKGKEWHRVFWLQTGPSPWARKDWELEQENNLLYVATTRAQRELVLIGN